MFCQILVFVVMNASNMVAFYNVFVLFLYFASAYGGMYMMLYIRVDNLGKYTRSCGYVLVAFIVFVIIINVLAIWVIVHDQRVFSIDTFADGVSKETSIIKTLTFQFK